MCCNFNLFISCVRAFIERTKCSGSVALGVSRISLDFTGLRRFGKCGDFSTIARRTKQCIDMLTASLRGFGYDGPVLHGGLGWVG